MAKLATFTVVLLLLASSGRCRNIDNEDTDITDSETFDSVFGFSDEDFLEISSNSSSDPSRVESPACWYCAAGANMLLAYHATGATPKAIVAIASEFCSLFKVEAGPVCDGMIRNVGRDLFAILDMDRAKTISAHDICGMALEGQCQAMSKRMNAWKLDIPDLDREPPTRPPVWPIGETLPTQKILHLSDLHLQLSYQIGSNALCGMPVCCEAENIRNTASAFRPASIYGEYSCDLPSWMLAKILEEVRRKHSDIEYIFLTGDFPAHDCWKQNRTGNLQSIEKVVELVARSFPGVPVFPAVGNHEGYPVNMFPDPKIAGYYSPKWLYERLGDLYAKWLPELQQQETLRDAGYYSVLLRNGLKLISLNTNFCNNFNFWLLLNFEDPHKHLEWLYMQLHKSEILKESVYIIGHIPPGVSECLGKWSEEYNRIINRFRNTIAGQFFGHTHKDEFEIFFAKNKEGERVPVSIAYIGPSQTPIDSVNPAYRIYTIDGVHDDTTNLILDHDTYWMNLTKTQHTGEVDFRHEYSVKKDLGLANLSASEWYGYVEKMAKDTKEFQAYRERFSRFGPLSKDTCNSSCKKQILCNLVTANSLEGSQKSKECKLLSKLVDESSARRETTYYRWWNNFPWGSSSPRL